MIVDDASTIGGTWCRERLYHYLVAEAHYGLFEFSDLKMPRDGQGVTEFGLIAGNAVHDYLLSYARKFGLDKHLRLNTKIERARRTTDSHWRLTIAGSDAVLVSEKLIVATGLTSEPFMPEIPNQGFKGEVLHSKELGKTETVQKISQSHIDTVAVYGGSKSAFDAVYMLLRSGKRVEWIIRPGKGGPSMMTPLTILGQPSFYFNNTRFFGLWSPSVFSLENGGLARRLLHGPGPMKWFAQILVTGFWRLMAYLLQREAQYGRSENSKLLKPNMGLDSLFWSPATLGVMTHPNLWEEIHQGGRVTVRQAAIERIDAEGVLLSDRSRVSAGLLILATGWRSPSGHFIFSQEDALHFGLPSSGSFPPKTRQKWVALMKQAEAEVIQSLPILSRSPGRDAHEPRIEDDFHLYRSIVPASAEKAVDRSLAFIGFLRTAGAPIVYEAQALWAAAYLQGRLEVPPRDYRERDTARVNAWVRRRYLCGRKVPFALFDFLSVSKPVSFSTRTEHSLIKC